MIVLHVAAMRDLFQIGSRLDAGGGQLGPMRLGLVADVGGTSWSTYGG